MLATLSLILSLSLCKFSRGGTYLTGAAHHWRKEERESGRDLFLNQQFGTRSREYRCAVQEACHSYVREACQRNRGEQLQVKLTREQACVNMSSSEGEVFLKETSDVQSGSFAITPDQLGDKAGDVLSITSSSKARRMSKCAIARLNSSCFLSPLRRWQSRAVMLYCCFTGSLF